MHIEKEPILGSFSTWKEKEGRWVLFPVAGIASFCNLITEVKDYEMDEEDEDGEDGDDDEPV
ncbi:MAG: hypothetical protein LUG93_11730 [Lachnospiraceae bacterium]|nr:hypothetical protein [Lachnospiraceae bacterium]